MPRISQTVKAIRAGLMCDAGPIPLQGVAVDAQVSAISGRVTITQRYRNDEQTAIEAVYVFPLDDSAAVDRFEAVVDGTHFVGEVHDRDEAFAKYDEALTEGHGAYLLDMESGDVFRASIGNVPPGGEVLIRLSYVSELTLDGRALRFTLPTTVSPRYAPFSDRTCVGESRERVLNPPVQWSVPYGLAFTLHADMPGPIRRVESPSHPVAVSIDDRRATVTLSARETALDRDVVILLEADAVHQPLVRIERDDAGRLAAALSVTPAVDAVEVPAEIVFLVDRSGSMEGSSIEEVRNALQLCLRSLTSDCSFNIVCFGTTYVTVFPASRPYNQETLDEAAAYVAGMTANFGGTELLPALEHVLLQPRTPGLPRRVVLLTDGDVTNTEAVMALVAAQEDTRVFTFGIGNGPSAALIRGVARVGRGEAEFIRPGERIEAKVMRQFARLRSDGLDDVRIDWGTLPSRTLGRVPSQSFAGSRVVSYALLGDVVETQVTIRARHGHRQEEWSVTVTPNLVVSGRDVAALAAHARIRELEDEPTTLRSRGSQQLGRVSEAHRAEVARLAKAYGLLSRETSFVAVEQRPDAAPAEIALRRIPVALRAGWGGVPVPMAQAMSHLSMPMALRPAVALNTSVELGVPGKRRGAGRLPLTLSGPSRTLDSVVALQAAGGYWSDPRRLAGLMSVDHRDLESARRSLGRRVDDKAFATMLALVWLARHAAAEQVEWSRLAAKAEAWLEAHVPDDQRAALRQAIEQLIHP